MSTYLANSSFFLFLFFINPNHSPFHSVCLTLSLFLFLSLSLSINLNFCLSVYLSMCQTMDLLIHLRSYDVFVVVFVSFCIFLFTIFEKDLLFISIYSIIIPSSKYFLGLSMNLCNFFLS